MRLIRLSKFPGYSAGENGYIYSHFKRFSKGRHLGTGRVLDYGSAKRLKGSPSRNKKYLAVCLANWDQEKTGKPWKSISVPVHVAICEAFHGQKPVGAELVRHLNGKRWDNRPENLAWGTYSDNVADAVSHGTRGPGLLASKRVFSSIDQIAAVVARVKSGTSQRSIARELGCHRDTIGNLMRGVCYKKELLAINKPSS